MGPASKRPASKRPASKRLLTEKRERFAPKPRQQPERQQPERQQPERPAIRSIDRAHGPDTTAPVMSDVMLDVMLDTISRQLLDVLVIPKGSPLLADDPGCRTSQGQMLECWGAIIKPRLIQSPGSPTEAAAPRATDAETPQS